MRDLTEDILHQVKEMRDRGQEEYAHDEDNVFANFDRVSNLLEVDRKKVLMTYMLKHIDGISAYIKGHESQREDVTGRITDCIVYLMLLWGMIEDDSISRKESNPSMHRMWDRLQGEDGSIHHGSRGVLADRVQSEGDMPEVREEGAGVEEHNEEVGEPT